MNEWKGIHDEGILKAKIIRQGKSQDLWGLKLIHFWGPFLRRRRNE